ncbi:MAG: microcin ABC transporter ATP-binding protein [Mesorhizobium amorphae]|nr:MAG: microcin ABC transporter ATP-binding protein [Mesorhizobium amorphae]
MSLLRLENLGVSFPGRPLLDGVSLSVDAGETLALVGESGSGKSLTALAIMRLLPPGMETTGRISVEDTDLLPLPERRMQALRGGTLGMVFQEPMTALNPLKSVGEQVAEGIRIHARLSRAEAEEQAAAMLARVGLPADRAGLARLPHELSGGQRQRVVIAIACAAGPRLLIADEPTTALDVVLQAQVLDLLRGLVEERGLGLLLISHDLAVVADMADRIAVLKEGRIVEGGDALAVLTAPSHPYTQRLLAASARPAPRLHPPIDPATPLLEVRDLVRDYPGRRTGLFSRMPPTRAVDGVSLSIAPGQSVALVGRSGCGKSTLARAVLGLEKATSGTILFDGKPFPGADDRAVRRRMQVVFQDPFGSFDPRRRVEALVGEPLHLLETQPSRAERREAVARALSEVGLPEDSLDRFPHEFSGGQRQRLAIARAIILRPSLVVADEPVSALDVSIRARILALFRELNARLGLAYLFITHDLDVARAIADEVLVMDKGEIVERGTPEAVFGSPESAAARALVEAAPDLERAIRRRSSPQRG